MVRSEWRELALVAAQLLHGVVGSVCGEEVMEPAKPNRHYHVPKGFWNDLLVCGVVVVVGRGVPFAPGVPLVDSGGQYGETNQ